MKNIPTSADRDPSRNIQVLLGGAGLLFFGWSWANFSGPFRLFIDLQMRYLGNYLEAAAAVASATTVTAAVVLAAVLLKRAYPNLSASAADAIVAILLAAASAGALWQVWSLWQEAAHMPRLSDPVKVLDLGTIGSAAPSIGHVRVIGKPDRTRQVLSYITGRRAGNSYWEAWVPLISRQQQNGSNAPIQIVATLQAADQVAASNAVPDDPQGMLLFDSVDTRTVYEARQEGLDMPEHLFVLYSDEGVRFDKLVNAALLGFFVVFLWGFVAHGWIKERRDENSMAMGSPVSPPPHEEAKDLTPADTTAPLAPISPETPDSPFMRVVTGAAIGATGTGMLLWEMFGFFPSHFALFGYAAAAVTLVVSLALMWFARHFEVPKPVVAAPATRPAGAHALNPPQGTALLYVLRDEPGASSPSYKRVDVDGARVADLVAHRYTVVTLQPGPHTLAVNTRISLVRDTVARFEVASGDIVAYRLQIPFFGPMRLERIADIQQVCAAIARLKAVQAP